MPELTEKEQYTKRTGSYVDRFFIYMKEAEKPLEVCSPRLLVAEFFEFLLREEALKIPRRKTE
jgi:hypothetical protein